MGTEQSDQVLQGHNPKDTTVSAPAQCLAHSRYSVMSVGGNNESSWDPQCSLSSRLALVCAHTLHRRGTS